MALLFQPAIYKPGGSVLVLPQPITQCRIEDGVKMDQHVVPMKQGSKSYGPVFSSTKISITGSIGQQAGSQKVGEDAMWGTYNEMREYLRTITDLTPLEFFVFYNTESDAEYRKFRQVFLENAQLDLGDQSWTDWPYELIFRADDPTIYETEPGAEDEE